MESPLDQLTNQITNLKDKHVFFFHNSATNQKISKGYAGKYESQNVWQFEDIEKKHGSVLGFLQHLKAEGMPGVRIQFYKKKGNRYLKSEIPDVTCILNASQQQPQQQAQKPQETPAFPQPQNYNMTAPQPQATLSNVGLAGGQSISLGFAQLMDYERKSTRLELIEAEKNRLEAEVLTLRTDKSALQVKLDEATSKCTLANDRLELEKDKITSGAKSSFENLMHTPAAVAFADKFPELLKGILESKNPQASLGGAVVDPFAGLTEKQAQLIKFIISAQLSDDMVLNYYNLFTALQSNPSLMGSFNQFINPSPTV
ncbi:hypothetical protein [Bizionia myxarmorum]|uniref:Uncharacterized protein n=1 Tax=Bizionia myxarmorum TaxID=291186 RepID=A0A5D0R9Z5_9FLAO|nr:hypothetical protein [Bizionia myxarmorum]TYB78332.1 hypothetical protein ES674_00700 [Bizionia myxarmorum]